MINGFNYKAHRRKLFTSQTNLWYEAEAPEQQEMENLVLQKQSYLLLFKKHEILRKKNIPGLPTNSLKSQQMILNFKFEVKISVSISMKQEVRDQRFGLEGWPYEPCYYDEPLNSKKSI